MYAQSCPTLCNPVDCSLPGSFVHGISQQDPGEGCHLLLQRILPTQGPNGLPQLLQRQSGSLPLSHPNVHQ